MSDTHVVLHESGGVVGVVGFAEDLRSARKKAGAEAAAKAKPGDRFFCTRIVAEFEAAPGAITLVEKAGAEPEPTPPVTPVPEPVQA